MPKIIESVGEFSFKVIGLLMTVMMARMMKYSMYTQGNCLMAVEVEIRNNERQQIFKRVSTFLQAGHEAEEQATS
jgi:hypothetical protein